MTMFKKCLALLGASLTCAAAAPGLGEQGPAVTTATTTIPYLGSSTTSAFFTPCSNGPVTLVIQTPIQVPSCTTPTPSCTTSTPSPSHTPGGPCLLVNPLCAPAGLDIDYYSNPFVGYSSGSLPASYYITQGLRPLDSSLTDVTFFPQDNIQSLPIVYPDPSRPALPYFVGWRRATNGGITVDANNFTLVYQGFYRARQTGSHTICSSADNENNVFFGHGSAFGCLDGRPSADAVPLLNSTGGNFINGVVCRNVTLVSGLYYPVRNVMGNWQGPSAFNFTIQEPGVAFESRTNVFTGRAYPRRCGIFI